VNLRTYLIEFRVISALKVVLAAVICILINNILHLGDSYLSVLYVFLILNLFHGQAFKVGMQTLIAAIFFSAMSLLFTYLFVESKVLYLVIMSLLLFFCMNFIKKFFLATLLSGVVIAIITYMAVNYSVTEASIIAKDFVTQMVLAVLVCWIVDDYIWPHRSRKTFDLTLSTVYTNLAELYKNYSGENINDRYDHTSMSMSLVTFSTLMNLLKRINSEEGSKNIPVDAYIKMITFSRGIYIKTEVLEGFILKQHSFLSDERVYGEINKILLIISERLKELGEAVAEDREVITNNVDITSSIKSLHERYREMHEVKEQERDYYEDLLAFGAMLPVLDEVAEKLGKIEESFNIIQRKEYGKLKQLSITHTPEVEKRKSKPFVEIGEETAKVAIRTVIIYWFLLFGQIVLGLPGESQVSFYAILFGIIPNLGQAFMKSSYGVAGIISGILYGFLALIIVSTTTHFTILLLLFCAGFFMASYVTTNPKDISAAGLQAGLVIPYALLYNTGPQVDLDAAVTRFLALLSAVLIGLIVLHLVWPVNPYSQLREKISKAIRVSGGILDKLLTLDIKEKQRIDSLVLPLAASLPTSTSLLHDAEYVVRRDQLHAEQYLHIIESLEVMFAELETIKRLVFRNIDDGLFHLYLGHMAPDYKLLCSYFVQVSEQLGTKKDITLDISDLKLKIEADRAEFRDSEVWRNYEPGDIERNVLIVTSMDSLLDSLHKISGSINEINGLKTASDLSLQASGT